LLHLKTADIPLLSGLAGSTPASTDFARRANHLSDSDSVYQRLLAKGKEPKGALVACMRKLIVILNTMIARRQKWDPRRYAVN
jgi:transposase